MSTPLELLLGDRLVDSHQNLSFTNQLFGKLIGLFFSSSNCRPCALASNALIRFYKLLYPNETHTVQDKLFEIVCIPCGDIAYNDFQNKQIQWKSLIVSPQSDFSKKDPQHMDFFLKKINSVPHLVIIYCDRNGTYQVVEDYPNLKKINTILQKINTQPGQSVDDYFNSQENMHQASLIVKQWHASVKI